MQRDVRNMQWMLQGGRDLAKEFEYRFDKSHLSAAHFDVLAACIDAIPKSK